MRYSILGFSQEQVLSLQEEIIDPNNGKSKVIRIDANDLLILRDIADFMNRRNVIKYVIDEKTFFNVKYSTIIEDLPILNLKQQALSDRLNKLCHFGLLEKAVVKNQSGSYTAFRIGKKYEECVYDNSYGTSTQIHLHKYSNTSAKVAEYKCNNNIILNNSSTINSTTKEEDTNVSTKKDDLFEECWKSYNRKGSKKNAYKRWQKLTDNDKQMVKIHIPFYIQSNDRKYLKDFEGYLNGRYFENVVYDKRGCLLFDPERNKSTNYTPQAFNIDWSETKKCYRLYGIYDGGNIYDGYDDDDRPNGAKIMLSNAQGFIVWNSETKKWEHEQGY